MFFLVILVALSLGFILLVLTVTLLEDRRLRRIADERRGETICQFARSLDYRRLDTKVIRGVYEALQDWLGSGFPVRASDDLDETYRIDRDDLDDLAVHVASRCSRSVDGWERNPFCGRVSTVSDLIEFLCALPMAEGA